MYDSIMSAIYAKRKWLGGRADRNALLSHLINHIAILARRTTRKSHEPPLANVMREMHLLPDSLLCVPFVGLIND